MSLGAFFTLAQEDTGDHAHQQLSGGGVQSATVPKSASGVILCARTANAYITLDGTDPSSANGLEIIAGAQPVLVPVRGKLKMIAASAGAILNCLFVNSGTS